MNGVDMNKFNVGDIVRTMHGNYVRVLMILSPPSKPEIPLYKTQDIRTNHTWNYREPDLSPTVGNTPQTTQNHTVNMKFPTSGNVTHSFTIHRGASPEFETERKAPVTASGKKCECGAHAIKDAAHSDWCDLFG